MCSVASVLMAVLPMVLSQMQSDEVVVFYPTYGYLDEDGKSWNLLVHGVVYEPEADSVKRALTLGTLRRAVGVEGGAPEAAVFDRRVRLFLVDNERGKEISIRLGSQDYKAGTSLANGHFSAKLQLSLAEADRLLRGQAGHEDCISFQAVTPTDDPRRFVGRVQLIARSGLSVISDVDDTIKHTQVADRQALLRNTFLHDYTAVPGMAGLYQRWARQGAVFHYVSGSPWQLYRPLSSFLDEQGFPAGSFHLKLFRLTDSSALNLLLSQEKTKLQAIEPILSAFPDRRFVLVGDSGEQDPEIYGRIAREHPNQIAAILIRNVTDEAAEDERFAAAFEGIERRRWRLFHRPEQLHELLEELDPSHETTR